MKYPGKTKMHHLKTTCCCVIKLQKTTLGMIINKIQNDGGKYHHDYSGLKASMEVSGNVWRIQDDLVAGKEIGDECNPLSPGTVRSIQSHMFQEIKSDVKNNLIKQLEKRRRIKNDRVTNTYNMTYE